MTFSSYGRSVSLSPNELIDTCNAFSTCIKFTTELPNDNSSMPFLDYEIVLMAIEFLSELHICNLFMADVSCLRVHRCLSQVKGLYAGSWRNE